MHLRGMKLRQRWFVAAFRKAGLAQGASWNDAHLYCLWFEIGGRVECVVSEAQEGQKLGDAELGGERDIFYILASTHKTQDDDHKATSTTQRRLR